MIKARPRSAASTPTPTGEPRSPLRRALAVGILCEIFVAAWVIATELPEKVFISGWSISMPGILLLALVLLWAGRSAARSRRWFLQQRQMLLIYAMVSIAGILAGF